MSIIFPSLALDSVLLSLKEQEIQEDAARLKHVAKAADYYSGDQMSYIKDFIQRNDINEIPLSWINITKRIINRRSVIYKSEPTRYFEGIKSAEKYESMTEFKNVRMKTAERMTRLHGVIAVRPLWDGEQMRYQIIRSFRPYFENMDTINPIGLSYPIQKVGYNEYLWAYWDSEKNFIIRNDGTPLNNREQAKFGINDFEHGYGELPFAFFHMSDPIDDFWTPGADDLIEGNEKINLGLTDLNFELRYQSFKQLYATGSNLDTDKLQIGYNKLLKMEGDNIDVGVLDLQPRFVESIEVIKFQLNLISSMYDITMNWSIEGAPSGFSLVVRNIDLLQGWESDIPQARQWERDLYRAERAVAKQDARIELPDSLHVDFAEVEFPVDPKEERERWEWEFEHNLASKLDYLAAKSPDTPEEELQRQLEANRDTNETPQTGGLADLLNG